MFGAERWAFMNVTVIPFFHWILGALPFYITLGTTFATFFVGYLSLVRCLRYRRYDKIHAKHQKKFEEGTLTPEEAQEIVKVSSCYDMPALLSYSLAFSLFKTYTIPSISKLLAATRQSSRRQNISKRFVDTEILLSTCLGCPISGYTNNDRSVGQDPRAALAVARINYLHSKYKISNDDYLYTLILFATEPAKWAKEFGWREFSPLEDHAYCLLWTEIGKRMGVQAIPETPEQMRAWAKIYESEHMRPAPTNKELVDSAIEELMRFLPEHLGIRKLVTDLNLCLIEDPARIAMLQPKQEWYKHVVIRCTWKAAAFVQKWFMLPRSGSNYRFPVFLELPRNPDGSIQSRMHPTKSWVQPWYKPEPKTILGKFRNEAYIAFGLRSHPPGPSLRSHGYRLEELGPLHMENDGNEKVLKDAGELLGCPIVGAFSR